MVYIKNLYDILNNSSCKKYPLEKNLSNYSYLLDINLISIKQINHSPFQGIMYRISSIFLHQASENSITNRLNI